ncbi:MAG: peroxidase-related enzyme [Sinobacteraceae bacterium]|nr:peroxidase-related enzyme [Nevskiaceae bacterium]MCP5360082.1 peroxidase-related enzyme [Nevskiaceae bacterium]MCP5466097.1 peroxidase-related enzyme [Nevskiaceae bacterium]MCP5471499.1 peroxidase-related enzyme [Nevskiaceae bacterium]
MTRRYRAQPAKMIGLKLPIPTRGKLDPDLRKYFEICDQKIGFVPNVLAAYSFDATKLRAFIAMYNDLMLGESRLSRLEREMIAVVVSSANRCYYCLTAHGQAVREMSGDASLGETLVMNWRVAQVTPKQRAMLEFAHRLTVDPAATGAAERRALTKAGFSDRDIWDISSVAAFFNMTNRLATATDMMPNEEYHALSR